MKNKNFLNLLLKINFLLAVLILFPATQVLADVISADLSVTKVDTPDPVTAGSNLVYTITVSNGGPDAAGTAALSDTLPSGTTYVGLSSPAGWVCTEPPVGNSGSVSCTNTSMAVGSAEFTLTVNVNSSVAAGTTITNTATVSTSTPDPNPANNSASALTTVAFVADLSITKVNTPNPVTAGDDLTYTITVSNSGPDAAGAATLSDTLPTGTTFTSILEPSGWLCTTPAVGAGGLVSCTKMSMAAGSAEFTLAVNIDSSVAADTVISNTATVSSSSSDPSPANNSASASATVTDPATTTTTTIAGDICTLQVIPPRISRLIDTIKPVQLFILIGDEETVFARGDKPVWGTDAIRNLLKLKLGSKTVLAITLVNPFTAATGFYDVTLGDCTGEFEIR